ncbi:hypothetical protein [Mycolicibacterium gadium]|uniref:Glycosyltransferase RgtA/B/C/D-like domain-containing protein n=1 Tax=Mycolicibacterium gadium TaxID=1794 RepID=A0ABT6GYX9_MYCGU|nr:hypothetical protein [Mycolicibacterium gadium]MDG5486544.1 hypothetical protein [Mycolicibacterium gadium]
MTTTLVRPAEKHDTPVEPEVASGRRAGWLLFLVGFIGYGALGYYLFKVGYINPDATSRTGNAGYTVMSRYPHLGAVGFVWNPLPSFAQIPLMPLSHWWPELKTLGLTGVIQSAAFMAGAVVLMRRIALDANVSALLRWTGILAFALNPMVVLYGANGMSEAAFLFVLLWACRRLLQWRRTHGALDLFWAGTAFGLGYLVRYEALIAAAAATVVVMVYSFRRHQRLTSWRSGIQHSWHDGVVVAFPVIAAFALWALAGWLLDASLLAQFTSQYGNSAQIEASGVVGADDVGFIPLLKVIAQSVFGIQPLVTVVLIAVVVAAFLRRRSIPAIPLAIFGSVLTFQCVAILLGSTFGWFRFFIVLVPMMVVLLLVAWPESEPPSRPEKYWRVGLSGLMIGVLLTSLPVTWKSMLDPSIGKEEFGLRSVFWPEQYPRDQFWFFWSGEVAENTVRWFDSQNLPTGSVVIDTFGLARMWLASERPDQFVVRSDYDFFDKLNNPAETGVKYILVPRPMGLGKLDAVNIRYPTLWNTGAGIGTLVMTVTGPTGGPQFRIFRIHDRPANPPPPTP